MEGGYGKKKKYLRRGPSYEIRGEGANANFVPAVRTQVTSKRTQGGIRTVRSRLGGGRMTSWNTRIEQKKNKDQTERGPVISLSQKETSSEERTNVETIKGSAWKRIVLQR